MKQMLRQLFAEVLRDADPTAAMAPASERLLAMAGPHGKALVLGYGKAARRMANALRLQLPAWRLRGLVVVPEGDDAPLPPFEVLGGGHPLPTANSVAAGRRALELAQTVAADEGVVFLASGGGSAMLEAPEPASLTLGDLQATHQELIASGADIVAINSIRRQLSAVKGGRLGAAARAAQFQFTIELSDVPERVGAAVASSPSLPFAVDTAHARRCLDELRLWPRLPPAVQAALQRQLLAADGEPARESAVQQHERCTIASNSTALATCRRVLTDHGFVVITDTSVDDQPYQHAAAHLVRRLVRAHRRNPGRRVAIVSGGELSVPLPPRPGIGGRNQQFVLACARLIRGQTITVLSAGTDGKDGNSPAAGGIVDGHTIAHARRLGRSVHDHLTRCDAFPLLQALDSVLVTGPTGTNVRDVRVLIAGC